jgi:transcriptional regulator with XRE-family HTH domain
MDNLAEWLKQALWSRKMSQSDLAAKSGVTPAQISRILSGQRGASAETLTAIAHGLGISPITIYRKAGLLPEGGDDSSFAKRLFRNSRPAYRGAF